jgi:hypothetical protein
MPRQRRDKPVKKKPDDADRGLKFFTKPPIREAWRIVEGFFALTVGSGVGPRPAILNSQGACRDG